MTFDFSLVNFIFSISIGVLLFAFIMCIAIGIFAASEKKGLYFSLGMLSIVVALYQGFSFFYSTSKTMEESIYWLFWQAQVLPLFYPFYYHFIAKYTRAKRYYPGLILICIFSLFVLLFNTFLPYSIRFEEISRLQVITLPWGESVTKLVGTASFSSHLWTFSSLLILAWAATRGYKLIEQGRRIAGYLLVTYLLLQSLSAVHGYLISHYDWQSFYTGGFAFQMLIILMCFSLAVDLRKDSLKLAQKTLSLIKTKSQLEHEVAQKIEIENAIRHIAFGIKNDNKQAYYDDLVLRLCHIFETRYAFVGLLNQDNNEPVIDTISVAADGEIVANIRYTLLDTACAEAIENKVCCYPDNVQSAFPNSTLLSEMSIAGCIAAPLTDELGEVLGVIGVCDDKKIKEISQRIEILSIFANRSAAEIKRDQAEQKIKHMAYYDYLTNLPNNALMHEKLKEIQKRTIEEDYDSGMLLVDLDNFKYINDSYGNDIADEVLRQVGGMLQNRLPECYVARSVGDEFAVLVENITEPTELSLCELAKKIIHVINVPIQVGERLLNIGCSIGIAVFPKDDINKIEIMRFAYSALQQAKDNGRDQYQLFDPELQRTIDEKLAINDKLQKALAADHLTLHYQVQIAADGSINGAEALIRWYDPVEGFISPDIFIPLAEESGLIHKIGDWVFQTAFNQLQQWRGEGFNFKGYLSINVSAWQFSQPDFVANLNKLLLQYQVASHQIVLELTETSILNELSETIDKLTALRALGFQIALDDFGTGYSSLAYLKDLPLDILKIDRAFIKDLDNSNNLALVESMLSISRHMGLKVVAEGIETLAQKQMLDNLGCQNYQGYYFSKPLDKSAFMDWCNKY